MAGAIRSRQPCGRTKLWGSQGSHMSVTTVLLSYRVCRGRFLLRMQIQDERSDSDSRAARPDKQISHIRLPTPQTRTAVEDDEKKAASLTNDKARIACAIACSPGENHSRLERWWCRRELRVTPVCSWLPQRWGSVGRVVIRLRHYK